jgi:hypothetical protein
MRHLDLRASILPGLSAAGFAIGMDIDEIKEIVNEANIVDAPPKNSELQSNKSVIVVRKAGCKVSAVFFGNDQVRLCFNTQGKLFCIFLFEGYEGKYRDSITIGTQLQKVSELYPIEYDDGDEMCYVENVPGIAFCGTCCALEVDPVQPVSGFCVHDWKLQNA